MSQRFRSFDTYRGFFFKVMQAVLYHAAQRKQFIEYDFLKPSANNGIIKNIKTKFNFCVFLTLKTIEIYMFDMNGRLILSNYLIS